jgi:hypothetical protein
MLRRAWHRTDPNHMTRVFGSLRGALSVDLPPVAPPAPGTEVELVGVLTPGRLAWGDLLLDENSLDDALASALELDHRAPGFRARITVRVLDDAGSGISEPLTRGDDGQAG